MTKNWAVLEYVTPGDDEMQREAIEMNIDFISSGFASVTDRAESERWVFFHLWPAYWDESEEPGASGWMPDYEQRPYAQG